MNRKSGLISSNSASVLFLLPKYLSIGRVYMYLKPNSCFEKQNSVDAGSGVNSEIDVKVKV